VEHAFECAVLVFGVFEVFGVLTRRVAVCSVLDEHEHDEEKISIVYISSSSTVPSVTRLAPVYYDGH
jgi:hypothetical protein